MTTSNDDLEKILAQLDSGNDDHWTDDGAPSLTAVQLLANDTTITREQINKAIPGFSRAGTDEEPADVDEVKADVVAAAKRTAENQGVMVSPRAPSAPDKPDTDLSHEDGLNIDPDDPMSEAPSIARDRLKEIMTRRVENAQARLDTARLAVIEAQSFVTKCETFLAQNLAALHKAFPPMHPMDAIKAHLAAQMKHRAEQIGRPDLYAIGGPRVEPASPLDARMGIRDKRQVRGAR